MRGAWGDGVVPLRVELVALDVEACHLRVADLDPLGVAARVEDARLRRKPHSSRIASPLAFASRTRSRGRWGASRSAASRSSVVARSGPCRQRAPPQPLRLSLAP